MMKIWFILITSIFLVESKRPRTDAPKKEEEPKSLCTTALYEEHIPVQCVCWSILQRADCRIDHIYHSNELTSAWPLLDSIKFIKRLSFSIEPYKGTNRSTPLRSIPYQYINDFPYLTKYEFVYSNPKVLPRHAFVNLYNINDLKIEKNTIVHIYPEAIGNLSNLETLILEQNNLKTMDKNAFFNIPFLKTLNLGWNKIKRLMTSQFKSLPSLRRLILNHNRIKRLSQDQFAGISKVHYLDLSDNKLITLENNTFRRLLNLRKLTLADNHIDTLEPDTFRGLLQLEALDLANNSLVQLHSNTFTHLPRLMRLDLSQNMLMTLTIAVIAPLYYNFATSHSKNIRELHLDGNSLECSCSLAWIYPLARITEDIGYMHAINRTESHCYFNDSCADLSNCTQPYNEIQSDKTYSDDYYLNLTKIKPKRGVEEPPKEYYYNKIYVNLLDIPVEALECDKASSSNEVKSTWKTVVMYLECICLLQIFLPTIF